MRTVGADPDQGHTRIPATALGGLDGDDPARAILEAQDREGAAVSDRPNFAVRSISGSSIEPANDDFATRERRAGKR